MLVLLSVGCRQQREDQHSTRLTLRVSVVSRKDWCGNICPVSSVLYSPLIKQLKIEESINKIWVCFIFCSSAQRETTRSLFFVFTRSSCLHRFTFPVIRPHDAPLPLIIMIIKMILILIMMQRQLMLTKQEQVNVSSFIYQIISCNISS